MKLLTEASDRFLTRHEVEQLTRLSRSWIYDAMSKGSFPQAIKLGGKAVRSLQEIEEFLERQKKARKGN